MRMNTSEALIRAISICGTQQKLAAAVGVVNGRVVRQAHIATWKQQGRVPAAYCPAIERATGGRVRCEELAPGVAWDVVRTGNGVSLAPPEICG